MDFSYVGLKTKGPLGVEWLLCIEFHHYFLALYHRVSMEAEKIWTKGYFGYDLIQETDGC
jgi:hypothetical protein